MAWAGAATGWTGPATGPAPDRCGAPTISDRCAGVVEPTPWIGSIPGVATTSATDVTSGTAASVSSIDGGRRGVLRQLRHLGHGNGNGRF